MKRFFENKMRLISIGIAATAFIIGGVIFCHQMFFGNVNAKVSAPYVTGAPESASVYVTKQSSEAVPLTSENENLPKIPTTKGVKGSETNPFVVLEIIPDHSEQAISYMVPTKEEGLPFDPMELGISICKDYNKNMVTEYKNGSTNFNNFLFNQFGGVFNNNNHYDIYTEVNGEMGDSEAGHPAVDYTTIKNYYTVSVPSGVISSDDFKNYTIEELAQNYPGYFVTDDNGTEIREIARQDNQNWERITEQTASYKYEIKLPAGAISEEEYQNDTVSTLAKRYPDLFKKGIKDGWQEVEVETASLAAKYDSKWTKKSEKKTIWDIANYNELKEGYLYCAGAGNGKLCMDGDITYDWNKATFTSNNDSTKNEWTFYADIDDLPTGAEEISKSDLISKLNSDKASLVGRYIKIANNTSWINGVEFNVYTYSIDVTENNYTFKYYNLAVNDLLKHRLFERENEDEYKNFHLQVISVTPKEINEMDKNDTAETLSYIERADMFYVGMFYAQDDGTKRMIEFTNKYVLHRDEEAKYYDFSDNDLEWDDCMKIIDRLCNNRNLPLIYENAVGQMLNKGVNEDGSATNHIYLNENFKDLNQVGSINNMAKLYLVATQMDLTAQMNRTIRKDERNFYRDIFPYFQKIAIKDPVEGSAKYTGYYKRPDGIYGHLCECGASEDYKERGYYLWGKAMFLPNVILTNEQVLIDSYGYSENYINGGAGKASNFDIGNKKFGQTAGETNMDAACGIFGDILELDSNGKPILDSEGKEKVKIHGNDDANVAIVYDGYENTSNPNKTILDNSGFNNAMKIAEIILSNASKQADDLVISILPFKQQYVKLSDTEAMLDYNRDAKYRSDKDLTLKLAIQNSNNEDCILESVIFIKTDEEGNEIGQQEWYVASKNDAEKAAYKAKNPKKKVLDADNNVIEEEEIIFNTEDEAKKSPYTGIKIPKTSTLKINLPYTRSEWLDGFDKVRIVAKSRFSYKKKNRIIYETSDERCYPECYQELHPDCHSGYMILGRGLFNLN